MQTTIYPSKLSGTIIPHASKSMIHRVLLCSAFAKSKTIIIKPLLSDDIKRTISIITTLGAKVSIKETALEVTPIQTFKPVNATLECGDSATTLRMFAPIIAYFNKGATFRISDQLKRRIKKSDFKFIGLDYEVKGNLITFSELIPKSYYVVDEMHTTQVVSGLLFLAPLLNKSVTIEIKASSLDPYLILTSEVLKIFGVEVEINQSSTIRLTINPTNLEARSEVLLRNDYSNAAGLMLTAMLSGEAIIKDHLSLPLLGDEAIFNIVKLMGCEVETNDEEIVIIQKSLKPITFDFSENPDLAPVVIATSTLLPGESIFTGLSRLVDKESNRLVATMQILTNLGAKVSLSNDTLKVQGPTKYEGGRTISSYHDHRIVFMITLIASIAEKPITILNSEAINKSYPTFFNDFALLGGKYQNE